MALRSASTSTNIAFNSSTPSPSGCTPATARLIRRLPSRSSTAHIGFTLDFLSKRSAIRSAARAASQQSPQLREAPDHHRKYAAGIDDDDPSAISSPLTFTGTSTDQFSYWNTHSKGHVQIDSTPRPGDLQNAITTPGLLTAELQLLACAASDRAEMHSILAQQRDNWNKLFQGTLTSTSLAACVLSGLATSHNAGLCSLPALLLNAGTAAMMAVINQFQPSQLAEEQRTAARLFRKLANDIHSALQVSPHLRQSTPLFFDDCKRRLHALDKAFPMPLTPGGLEKFPTKVVPPVLIEPKLSTAGDQYDCHELDSHVLVDCSDQYSNNGWDMQLTHDLRHITTMLRHSDIPKYTGWAQNLVKANKCLAIAAPCFAASAAVLNAVAMCTTVLPTNMLGMWAATFSVLATFVGSFSNDMQLGMVFELYRNSAGYYKDVETTIEETLGMPVKQRENGTLFRQRIAYQLGRWPTSQAEPILPKDATEGGTLF
ncbi:hypothetical protein L7F22_067154 [Adiantum nelumboides]|nr:hypothetical protein [Adiantum nelumboides]MCO5612883.1 hypothetical protein [Adiantum nelumboides]